MFCGERDNTEGAGKGETDLKEAIRHDLKRLPWLIFFSSFSFLNFLKPVIVPKIYPSKLKAAQWISEG